MSTIISVILFVVALGSLICLHELGHFSMAKLFNVYCHEFSIGFGPAILHKRKKGKETYFSIRVIPVGGYVSMYGEEDLEEIEPGLKLTEDRSIEGIKKWKKAIILVAGIVMNALIAITLFGVKNLCFPQIYPTRNASVAENSIAAQAGFQEDDKIYYFPAYQDETGETYFSAFSYEYKTDDGIIHAGSFYIVDPNVEFNGFHYVLTFDYYTNKTTNNFTDGMSLYLATTKEDVLNENNVELNKMFSSWASLEGSPDYYPDFTKDPYEPSAETEFSADIYVNRGEDLVPININFKGTDDKKFESVGLGVKIGKYWDTFGNRFKNIWVDFGNSSVAVFKGIGTLFTKGGIKNMSGIVGIFTTSKTLYETQTFATYLYFWGLISVNLAIFNLLPFPGLDGWQLLVTIIEAISKKKIPTKFKTIMSIIGFVLLAILMIAILVVDIGRLV